MIKDADIAIKSPKRKKLGRELEGFLFSFAPVLRFLLFGLVPLIAGLAMAFLTMEYTYDIAEGTFCGFDNFLYVLDPANGFWKAVGNTLLMALAWPISMGIALLVSMLLTKDVKGKPFFRTVYFIPFVCSVVALTLMWNVLLDYNYGPINQLIENIFGTRINFRGDADWYIPGLILMMVWSTTGYKIVILTAALTTVNKTYYEAASLDGANAWQKFKNITLPAISPTMFFLLVTGIINVLQEFTRSQVWNTSGGPNGKGITIVFYLYREAFDYNNMGHASAVAWILSIMIVIVTIINFVVSKKWVKYD